MKYNESRLIIWNYFLCVCCGIVAPSVNEHMYVSRKHYHNINVYVVFSVRYRIIDIVTRWPGPVHDATRSILDVLQLKILFEQKYGSARCYLLGDQG